MHKLIPIGATFIIGLAVDKLIEIAGNRLKIEAAKLPIKVALLFALGGVGHVIGVLSNQFVEARFANKSTDIATV